MSRSDSNMLRDAELAMVSRSRQQRDRGSPGPRTDEAEANVPAIPCAPKLCPSETRTRLAVEVALAINLGAIDG